MIRLPCSFDTAGRHLRKKMERDWVSVRQRGGLLDLVERLVEQFLIA